MCNEFQTKFLYCCDPAEKKIFSDTHVCTWNWIWNKMHDQPVRQLLRVKFFTNEFWENSTYVYDQKVAY